MVERNPSQFITTLNAKALIGRLLRADHSKAALRLGEGGGFVDSDVILRTEKYSWCPLFDQLTFCLEDHGMELQPSDGQFMRWFMYLDFSSLKNEMAKAGFLATSYGRAMNHLIEKGFSIEDAHGRIWHYTVFDMSASNARASIVSFLADAGYDESGRRLEIYADLNRRLNLDIDFQELTAEEPGSVPWNKFFAYRGLYLTTAQRVPACDGFTLSEENVLVVDVSKADDIPCDVRRADITSVDESGTACLAFPPPVSADEGGKIKVKLFDGEGLIAPDYAAHLRAAVFGVGDGDSQPSSFQIRMPFAKGVVHEVDFHRFMAEALALDDNQYQDLLIEDVYGVPRRLADVKLILTTDMLKCYEWLGKWLSFCGCEREFVTRDVTDPMMFYFAEMAKYDHALYVLPRKRRLGAAHQIAMNYQHLSTLDMPSDEFDDLMSDRFFEMGEVLFSLKDAQSVLLASSGEDDADDEGRRGEGASRAYGSDAALYAVSKDKRYLYDPHIKKLVFDAVNAKLVDYAVGKVPVKGTLRLLSQDLLSFLCCLLEYPLTSEQRGTVDMAGFAERVESIKAQCLAAQEVYLPHLDEPVNKTGWLAVFRNPHMSRSEQCALRPVTPGPSDYRTRYLGHLADVAMVSCESTAPMVLGGADYDGDAVHIYDDAAIVNAVLRGVYVDPDAEVLERRFPLADLSGSGEEDEETDDRGVVPTAETIGRHITASQLLRSFQSNVGILSNSAFRLGTILYGEYEGCPSSEQSGQAALLDDACANYTIAVGADIDSVKTGIRLNTQGLVVKPSRKKVSLLGVSGKIVPRQLDFLHFVKNVARELKQNNLPIWEYERLVALQPGRLDVFLRSEDSADFVTLDLDASFARNNALQGVSVSNVQRLPWLMMKEARRIHARLDAPDYIGNDHTRDTSPLEDLYRLMAISVDQEKLKKIMALVRAYQAAMWRLRMRDWRANAAKRSKAFGKARRRAQEYPTGFTAMEIDSILSRAVLDMRDYFALEESPSFSDVLQTFKDKGFTDWALQPAGERRDALQRFLPGLVFEGDFYAILESDALVNGFMIPFYLVGAAQAAENADAILGSEGSLDSSEGEKRPAKTPDYVLKNSHMYDELIALIDEHLKAKSLRSVLKEKLILTLRERILSVLSEEDRLLDYLCVLKYEELCFSDKHHDTRALFWDLLTPEDLKEVLG